MKSRWSPASPEVRPTECLKLAESVESTAILCRIVVRSSGVVECRDALGLALFDGARVDGDHGRRRPRHRRVDPPGVAATQPGIVHAGGRPHGHLVSRRTVRTTCARDRPGRSRLRAPHRCGAALGELRAAHRDGPRLPALRAGDGMAEPADRDLSRRDRDARVRGTPRRAARPRAGSRARGALRYAADGRELQRQRHPRRGSSDAAGRVRRLARQHLGGTRLLRDHGHSARARALLRRDRHGPERQSGDRRPIARPPFLGRRRPYRQKTRSAGRPGWSDDDLAGRLRRNVVGYHRRRAGHQRADCHGCSGLGGVGGIGKLHYPCVQRSAD